jgi:ribosomal-protein-alanine N-acetyltransferase
MTPDQLAALHAAAFPPGEAWSASAFTTLLPQQGIILTGDLRAFALLRVVLDEGEVLTIACHPDHRRQGLAAAALDDAASDARAHGALTLHLEVAADNLPAQALYARTGFRPTGRRRGYYRRPGGAVDAILMTRSLAPAPVGESTGVAAP